MFAPTLHGICVTPIWAFELPCAGLSVFISVCVSVLVHIVEMPSSATKFAKNMQGAVMSVKSHNCSCPNPCAHADCIARSGSTDLATAHAAACLEHVRPGMLLQTPLLILQLNCRVHAAGCSPDSDRTESAGAHAGRCESRQCSLWAA